MTQTRRALWLPVLLAIAVACVQAPVKVETFDLERVDLQAIRSFALTPPPWDHPIAGADVEAEIREVLTGKGLREVPAESADMFVSYRGAGKRQLRRRTRVDVSTQYTVEEAYIEGTFEIDMFDPGSREVVWRGVGLVDIFSEPAIPVAARQAVRAILADWPPGAPAASP